jgi:hypothetical protein
MDVKAKVCGYNKHPIETSNKVCGFTGCLPTEDELYMYIQCIKVYQVRLCYIGNLPSSGLQEWTGSSSTQSEWIIYRTTQLCKRCNGRYKSNHPGCQACFPGGVCASVI